MRTRHPIAELPFRSPFGLGMEIMTLDALRARAAPGALRRPLRPAFHSLYLPTSGSSEMTVDFVSRRLTPGSALWVRAGQVQRLGPGRSEGHLVLFDVDFLLAGTHVAALAGELVGAPADGVAREPPTRLWRALQASYVDVAEAGEADVARVEALRHLLSALLLALEPTPAPNDRPDGLVRRFHQLLERDFRRAHDVEHYARRLGFSARTLARATQRATGQSPKALISERLVLEARRLLVHTEAPVSTIARDLGFREPAAFSAAFARLTGQRPSAFRRAMRGDLPGVRD